MKAKENDEKEIHQKKSKLHTIKHHAKKIVSNKQALVLCIFGLIIVGFSIFWTYFLFNKSLSLASYASADSAIFLEVDTSKIDINDKIDLDKFLESKQIDDTKIQDLTKSFLGYDGNFKDIDFLAPYYGIALLDKYENFKNKNLIYLVINDKTKFETYLSRGLNADDNTKISQSELNGNTYYMLPGSQSLYFSLFGKILILSSQTENIDKVLFDIKQGNTLRSTDGFRDSISNLAQFKPIYGFIKNDSFFGFNNLDVNSKDFFTAKVLDTMNFIAFDADFENNAITFDTYIGLKDEFKEAFSKIPLRKKYKADLSSILDESFDYILSGQDLEFDYAVMKDALNTLHPSVGLILDGVLAAKVEELFGEQFSLNDFLDLFSSEYQYGVKINDNANDFVFTLNIENFENAKDYLDRLTKKFVEINPISIPKIETVTLEDGTVSSKIVGLYDNITLSKGDSYEGFDISLLKFDSGRLLATAIDDKTFILASGSEVLKSSIDNLSKNPKYIPSDFQTYFDQVIFMSDKFLKGKIERFSVVESFVKSVWISEKLFDDGVYLKGKVELRNE